MTASMQKRILDALTERVEKAGLTPAIQQRWANTGLLLAQDGFATILALSYEFHDTYCSVDMDGVRLDELDLRDEGPPLPYRVGIQRSSGAGATVVTFPMIDYTDGQRIEAMLDLFTHGLPDTQPMGGATPCTPDTPPVPRAKYVRIPVSLEVVDIANDSMNHDGIAAICHDPELAERAGGRFGVQEVVPVGAAGVAGAKDALLDILVKRGIYEVVNDDIETGDND